MLYRAINMLSNRIKELLFFMFLKKSRGPLEPTIIVHDEWDRRNRHFYLHKKLIIKCVGF